ncbi:MAG: hypothetical protein ACJ0P6_07155 [Flavobacteriaceae bacterium]|tara:strand:+ start:2432 stop:2605 length:174 start_codon:yes stop_codon:yes gene_type:complete
MKSKFLIYALVFTVLLVVFQYVNSMRIIDKYENDIDFFKMKIEKLENENSALKAQMK